MSRVPLSPAAEEYLQTLGAELADAPASVRTAIVDDVRAHITDALEAGRDLPDVLAGLGSPLSVARESRVELRLPPRDSGDEDRAIAAARILSIAAVALAIVTAVFVSFLLPAFTTADGEGNMSTLTLFQSAGPGIALLTLAPAALAVIPLVVPPRVRTGTTLAVAVVMTVFSVISGFTIGGFYAPLALLLWAATIVPWRVRRGLDLGREILWRSVAAVALLLPVLLIVPGIASGVIEVSPGVLGVVGLGIACAVLAFVGRRLGLLIVATVGGLVMLLAMVSGGMLVLLLWFGGGAYLALGLAAFAATGRRGRA